MLNKKEPEYVLTVVQHTYCGDCIWLKGKITDVYIASGIVRGEDSKRWRMQILSPPWDRDARRLEFPPKFDSIDVPALKLEAGNKLVFATQDPALIGDLLMHLKWMLINRVSNAEIEEGVRDFTRGWKAKPNSELCAVGS